MSDQEKPHIKVVYRATVVSFIPYDEDHYPNMTLEEAINFEMLRDEAEKAEFLGGLLEGTSVKIDVGAYSVYGKPEDLERQ